MSRERFLHADKLLPSNSLSKSLEEKKMAEGDIVIFLVSSLYPALSPLVQVEGCDDTGGPDVLYKAEEDYQELLDS